MPTEIKVSYRSLPLHGSPGALKPPVQATREAHAEKFCGYRRLPARPGGFFADSKNSSHAACQVYNRTYSTELPSVPQQPG